MTMNDLRSMLSVGDVMTFAVPITMLVEGTLVSWDDETFTVSRTRDSETGIFSVLWENFYSVKTKTEAITQQGGICFTNKSPIMVKEYA